jgi:hypothetical protein
MESTTSRISASSTPSLRMQACARIQAWDSKDTSMEDCGRVQKYNARTYEDFVVGILYLRI